MPPAEAPIEIVLAVLRCNGRLCLVRRSATVRTGAGLWGVVTGYLEPGVEPLAQALTELAEELGLASEAVRLVRSAPAVALTSGASGKRFLVHAYLFESTAPDVTLNWEHEAVEWGDLARLGQPDCVAWQEAIVRTLLES